MTFHHICRIASREGNETGYMFTLPSVTCREGNELGHMFIILVPPICDLQGG